MNDDLFEFMRYELNRSRGKFMKRPEVNTQYLYLHFLTHSMYDASFKINFNTGSVMYMFGTDISRFTDDT